MVVCANGLYCVVAKVINAEGSADKPVKKGKELKVLDAKAGQALCKFVKENFITVMK